MKNITLKMILFIVISIVSSGILYQIQQKTYIEQDYLNLFQLGPIIGVLVVVFIWRDLWIPLDFTIDKILVIKFFATLILPGALFLIAFFVGQLLEYEVGLIKRIPRYPSLVLVGTIVGAISEEIAWRNFLQQRLERKFSPLFSAIVVGIVWGLWFISVFHNLGFVFMGGLLLFTISASIIIAWMLRTADFNPLLSVLFHVVVNLGFFILFRTTFYDPEIILLNGIVWGSLALFVIFLTGKQFCRY